MSKRSTISAVPVVAPKSSSAGPVVRERSAKMDAFIRKVNASPRFSFEGAAAALSEAMARVKAQS